MAVIQDTFDTYAGKYYEGQLIDSGMTDVITLIAEEDIKFGMPVVLGTTDKQCQLPTDEDDSFAGIAVRSGVRNFDDGTPGYKAGDVVSIVRVGRVAVKVVKAAVAGEVSGFKVTAASGSDPKKVEFQGTASANDLMITGSYHVEAGGVGALVAVQLNGSNKLEVKS